MPDIIPYDPLKPPKDIPWGYGVRPLPDSIKGLIGQQLTSQWNNMPELWRWRPYGWPSDPEFIERIIRKRTAEYTHKQYLLTQQFGPQAQADRRRWLAQTMNYQRRIGGYLGLAALMVASYKILNPNIKYPPFPIETLATNPTYIIDDWMETGKGFNIVKSQNPALIRLIPGTGIAYSNALVMTWHPAPKGTWREAHIYYTFPPPIRRYCMVAFYAASMAEEGPYYFASWMQWNWAGFNYWAGFSCEPQQVLYPWALLTHPKPKRFTAETLGRSLTMAFSPSYWIIDTETLEYTSFAPFGQHYNVKGLPVVESERTKTIGPAELHFQVWHPWKTFCQFKLDSVVVAEFGPYRSDLREEEKRRTKLLPLEPPSPEMAAKLKIYETPPA